MTKTEMIAFALAEDLPRGDLTTDALELETLEIRARLVAKEDLVLSGVHLFQMTFEQVDSSVVMDWLKRSGEKVYRGQTVASLRGSARSLLRAERVALNFIGHLSGIATLTRAFVDQVAGTPCKILDTRKTTPLLRELEKEAVRDGGGHNHRMNLSEAILIKDNHIAACGDLASAVQRMRAKTSLPIEVECTSLEEVRHAVQLRVERILLDNMTNDELRSARTLIPPSIRVEASGNMRLERVRSVAECGMDDISVGALTHSARSMDFSLEFEFPGSRL